MKLTKLSICLFSLSLVTPFLYHSTPAEAASSGVRATVDVQYLKPNFSDRIYRVDPGVSATPITHAEWVAAGSPKPGVLPMQFVKYAWQENMYAVSFIAGTARSQWVWETVNFDQWVRAGQPQPGNAGWITGSTYYTMTDAPNDVYVALNGVPHKMTFSEWQAAGSPAPRRLNSTLLKLSWQDTIASTTLPTSPMFNSAPLSLAQWAGYGYAPPRVATSFAGDLLYQSCTNSELFYSGPTYDGPITFAQWQNMGMRTPLTCDAARNQALNDASAFLAARGIQSGIAMYDTKSGRTYTKNEGQSFYAMSTLKVLYAAALMKQAQDAGRSLTVIEKDLIWRAITVSDNAAAVSLYQRIGGASGATRYAAAAGISGITFAATWGNGRTTAVGGLDMFNTIAAGGGLLNATNQSYLLSALRSVAADQRWGAPATTGTVAIKDGWDDTNREFYMHSLHNVQGSNRSYSAAIMTYNRTTYDKNLITLASNRLYRAMQ